MCHGQNNGIFRIELILGKKTRNLSPILGEDYCFFSDHLILETKFNKNGLKVPRFLKGFTNFKTRLKPTLNKFFAAPCVYLLLIHLLHLCDKYQANTKMQLWSILRLWFTRIESNFLVYNVCTSFCIIT